MNDQLMPEPTAAELIERYLKLRKGKKENEDIYATFIKEHFTNEMEDIELKLLDKLNKEGGDNIKTPVGTAFKSFKTSVTVADGREFRRHVIGEELWDLVDWRPAKTAINELVDAGEPLPPGLNRSVFTDVNVRSPSK